MARLADPSRLGSQARAGRALNLARPIRLSADRAGRARSDSLAAMVAQPKAAAADYSQDSHSGMAPRAEIVLFRGLAEDRRVSMEVYADHLEAGLIRERSDRWRIRAYQPLIPRSIALLPVSHQQRLRLTRYFGYPLAARRARGDLNHVIEHGYGHLALSLGAERTIVTVHDLIPILQWQGKIAGAPVESKRPWLSELSLRALRHAAHVIAISENTRRDLIRYLDCPSERVSVVYWGIDEAFRPGSDDEKLALRKSLGLPADRTRLILISGARFYKNEETSLAVMGELSHDGPGPLLVRLGPWTPSWRMALERSELKRRVIEIAELPHDRMWQLYNAVDCLLFPSWYEGCGLPPLEAMACGTPVVASNAGALPEVLGEAALMAPPGDVRGLTQALELLLRDPVRRQSQVAKGIAQARQFTWQRTARETAAVYDCVLASPASVVGGGRLA